jgi:hypothetical protein
VGAIEKDEGLVIRPEELERRLTGAHSICVVGSSRGGTSAAAYALDFAGIFMGDNLIVNCEDPEFVPMIRPDGIEENALAELVKRRCREHPKRWGFKHPDASFHMPALEALMPNVIFIAMMRSPLAVANTVMRREPAFADDPTTEKMTAALRHPMRYYSAIFDGIERVRAPVIVLDHETARYHGRLFVKALFDALGLPHLRRQELQDHLRSGMYRQPVPKHRYVAADPNQLRRERVHARGN